MAKRIVWTDHAQADIRRIEQRVIEARRHPPDSTARVQLHALPARPAEILEVSVARLRRRHEENIVGIARPEPARAPTQAIFQLAAQASLKRPRHHLFQRRIGGHRVRQFTGLIRIGAPQFDGRRGAAAFAVAEV